MVGLAMEGIETVKVYEDLVQRFQDAAAEAKDAVIEPTLTEADFGALIPEAERVGVQSSQGETQQAHYAAVETVFRKKFYDLLAAFSIDEPSAIGLWNLLDIVSIFSDKELCEPGLIFWLVEELLDSQTIDGCRKIFDYLESRRERITAKHFKQKHLIILRSCNELLRRLSRAEDTVFCGRVFIFLFQSFPLGDRSSVNLRGEFHVENVTTFDEISKPSELEVDTSQGSDAAPAADSSAEAGSKNESAKTPKIVTFDAKSSEDKSTVDLDTLYPIFWSLQASFSSPTSLFDKEHFAAFKRGLELTLKCFQTVTNDLGSSIKTSEESRRGVKRKRDEDGQETVSSFNPKYLTNRDLFDLEVSDIAFRRHILVQALILLDFMLSLTPTAKNKIADLSNKSVIYHHTLSDEDAAWAAQSKSTIASYLQQGHEGKFYYRMVDTVLSRDKNWVRWKAENCPPIEKPPVSVEQYVEAQNTLQKACMNRRLPPPPGASELGFLSKETNLDTLKDPARYTIPTTESFYRGIMNDDLDAEMGTEEDMQAARDARDSKVWRALRASRNRFNLCEKIQGGKNLKALSGENVEPDEIAAKSEENVAGETPAEANLEVVAPEA